MKNVFSIIIAGSLALLFLPISSIRYPKSSYASLPGHNQSHLAIDDSHNVELVGHLNQPANVVAVNGDYAYIGVGTVVSVVDISDPTSPITVGQTNVIAGSIHTITINNNRAYVNSGGIVTIFDITNPINPIEVGIFSATHIAEDLAVAGNYIFTLEYHLFSYFYALRIRSTSDLHSTIGNLEIEGTDLTVVGDLAYIAGNYTGLRIVNVANKSYPTEVTSYVTPGINANDVEVIGHYAYVTDANFGLRIIDISNPAAPFQIGLFDRPGGLITVKVEENYAYVVDATNGLRVIDISDPTSPEEVGFYDAIGGIAVQGDYVYLANRENGLLVLQYVEQSFSISGRITDIDLNPIPGISVLPAFGDIVSTNENGEYTIIDLSPGSYIVAPSQEGYSFLPSYRYVETPPSAENLDFIRVSPNDCDRTTSFDDIDEDGLRDGWEACGYDYDNDGNVDVDLPAMGANPVHKDIFVEIDNMEAGDDENLSHRPYPSAIEMIVDSFNNSPVINPDQSTGIHLHVDYGPTAPLTWGQESYWGSLSKSRSIPHQEYLGTCPVENLNTYNWSDFNLIKNGSVTEEANFSEARHHIFHYNLWVHGLCDKVEREEYLGIARLGSTDFIVSLGWFTKYEVKDTLQAGAFMHELGHNLGLKHGGIDDINLKPNYLSVMNYTFIGEGLIVNGTQYHYDYSSYALHTLNEDQLDETQGIYFTSPITEMIGTKWYCSPGLFDEQQGMVDLDARSTDWNCDGFLESLVSEDVNWDGSTTELISYSDWDKLVFEGGEIGGWGSIEDYPILTLIDEVTEDMLIALQVDIEQIYLPLVTITSVE